MKKLLILGALGLALAAPAALAQSYPPPLVQQINPNDLFQDIPNGAASAGDVFATAGMLGNYGATLAGNNPENVLVGGDFGVNLYQDGTTVSTITTTPTYVADQWAAFSGTSTTIAGAQETAAADIPAGFTASERITRSGTGVLQSCVAQEISSADSTRFQGTTAELDFHALAGSGFSAANSALSVFVLQGTGTDEGMANLAHTINSALGGSFWTGYSASPAANASVTLTTGWNRFTVAVPIASTTTELGVALCWTPVGASPSNDYFEFTGAQLTRNSALTSVAGTTGAALNPNDVRAKAYSRQPYQVEVARQLQYYWRQTEAASDSSYYGTCQATGSTTANCIMQFPVRMFKAPTLSYTAGTIGATIGTSEAEEAISAFTLTKASLTNANMAATTSSASAGITGFLQGGNSTGGGKIAFSARF